MNAETITLMENLAAKLNARGTHTNLEAARFYASRGIKLPVPCREWRNVAKRYLRRHTGERWTAGGHHVALPDFKGSHFIAERPARAGEKARFMEGGRRLILAVVTR
jgi:hypothetical protein